jgi:hypothetical protein
MEGRLFFGLRLATAGAAAATADAIDSLLFILGKHFGSFR